MDVIEAMETCSAARYLKPDPVPQDLIERVIYAATRASSPGNSQEWDFIVVRNPEAKKKIRDLVVPRLKAVRVGLPTTGRVTGTSGGNVERGSGHHLRLRSRSV